MDPHALCYLASPYSSATVATYLAAVRSLHIDLGFVDPMLHANRLARLIRGIKRSTGLPTSPSYHQPIAPHYSRFLVMVLL